MSGSGNLGGARIKGQRSPANEKSRDSTISAIMTEWKIGGSNLESIFPMEIRPTKELGMSATALLRSISKQMTHPVAMQLFMSECRQAGSSYREVTHKDFKKVDQDLKKASATSPAIKQAKAPAKKKSASSGQTAPPKQKQTSTPATAPSTSKPTQAPVVKKKAVPSSKVQVPPPPPPVGLFVPGKSFKGYKKDPGGVSSSEGIVATPDTLSSRDESNLKVNNNKKPSTASNPNLLSSFPATKQKKVRKSVTFDPEIKFHGPPNTDNMLDDQDLVSNEQDQNSRYTFENDLSDGDTEVFTEAETAAIMQKLARNAELKNNSDINRGKPQISQSMSPKRKGDDVAFVTPSSTKKIKSTKDNMSDMGQHLSAKASNLSLAYSMIAEPTYDVDDHDTDMDPESPKPLSDTTDEDADMGVSMRTEEHSPTRNYFERMAPLSRGVGSILDDEEEAQTPLSPQEFIMAPQSPMARGAYSAFDIDEAMTPRSPPEALEFGQPNKNNPAKDLERRYPNIFANRSSPSLLTNATYLHGGAPVYSATQKENNLGDEAMTPRSPVEEYPVAEAMTPRSPDNPFSTISREGTEVFRKPSVAKNKKAARGMKEEDTKVPKPNELIFSKGATPVGLNPAFYKPTKEHDHLVDASKTFRPLSFRDVKLADEGVIVRRLPLQEKMVLEQWKKDHGGETTYDVTYQGMNAIKIQFDLMWDKIKDKAEDTPRADVLRGLLKQFEVEIEGYQRMTRLVKPDLPEVGPERDNHVEGEDGGSDLTIF